ncbi:unnamed protein product [Lactuca saligna]|uniref:Transmembrane protein n=1 Tax=Lactuca saligna TaxID=75948 RepID=A0AA36ED49_LACSI|nr:unnamed protein product [Lactuca saligna]
MLLRSSSKLPPNLSYRRSILPSSLVIFSISSLFPSPSISGHVFTNSTKRTRALNHISINVIKLFFFVLQRFFSLQYLQKLIPKLTRVNRRSKITLKDNRVSALCLFFASITVSSSFIFSVFHQKKRGAKARAVLHEAWCEKLHNNRIFKEGPTTSFRSQRRNLPRLVEFLEVATKQLV